MAQRDELGGALRGLDRRDARDAQHVALCSRRRRGSARASRAASTMRPPARATRLVTSLAATSTMCACPPASKWVKWAAPRRRRCRPRRRGVHFARFVDVLAVRRVPRCGLLALNSMRAAGILASQRRRLDPVSRTATSRRRKAARRARVAAVLASTPLAHAPRRSPPAATRARAAPGRSVPAPTAVGGPGAQPAPPLRGPASTAIARSPLPDLGDSSQVALHARAGAQARRGDHAPDPRAGRATCDDPEVNDYLNELGHRLVAASRDAQAGLRVLRGARLADQRVRAARRLHRREHRAHPARAERVRARQRARARDHARHAAPHARA